MTPTSPSIQERLRQAADCRADEAVNLGGNVGLADAELMEDAADHIDQLREALTKINAIRNSIVGHQTVNWSAHIYPLVAALNEAGFAGEDYETARARALLSPQGTER